MKRLLITTDPGLDDAVALEYLLQSNVLAGYVVDIVAVAGNVSATKALYNIFSILDGLQPKCEVNVWSTISIPQKYSYNAKIHGDYFRDEPHDYSNYRGEISGYSGEQIDVLVLSPATVLRYLLSSKKIQLVDTAIIMGGGVNASNYKNLEFNQAMDKEAFDYVLKEKCVVVTLDFCRDFSFINYDCDALKCYEQNALLRNAEKCVVYDLIAAYCYVHRDSLETVREHILGTSIKNASVVHNIQL